MSFKEVGYSNDVTNWYGLFAPSATPEHVLKALRDAVDRAATEPQFIAAMAKIRTPINYRNHLEFRKYLDNAPSWPVVWPLKARPCSMTANARPRRLDDGGWSP